MQGGLLYGSGQKMPNMSTVAKRIAFTAKKIMNIFEILFIKMIVSKPRTGHSGRFEAVREVARADVV